MKHSPLLLMMIGIMAAVLCLACNTTFYYAPAGINAYSETVVVPGMSREELFKKTTLYWVNSGKSGSITVNRDEQYTVDFSVPKNDHASAQTINNQREQFYSQAEKLRKAVYTLPLDEEDALDLMEKGLDYASSGQTANAMECYYQVAIGDPFYIPAVVFYGAALGDLGRYVDAITILQLTPNVEGVPAMLAELRSLEQQRQIEEQRRIELAEQQRREAEQRRIEQEEQQARAWDALNDSLLALSAQVGQMNQNKSSGTTSQSTSASSSSGSSSARKSNYDITAQRRNYRQYEAAAKAAWDAVDSSSGGLDATSSRQRYAENQKKLKEIREEAARHGETIHKSEWETRALSK